MRSPCEREATSVKHRRSDAHLADERCLNFAVSKATAATAYDAAMRRERVAGTPASTARLQDRKRGRRMENMRRLVIALAAAITFGIAGLSPASAVPANGVVIDQAANTVQVTER